MFISLFDLSNNWDLFFNALLFTSSFYWFKSLGVLIEDDYYPFKDNKSRWPRITADSFLVDGERLENWVP